MSDVEKEQEWFISLIEQMKGINSDNKSVITALDFLKDCVDQRRK